MKKFIQIFNKVGGKEILCQYWHGHVLVYALVITLLLGFKKKSLEIVRLAVNNKLLKKLRKKYKKFIENYPEQENLSSSDNKDRKIWVCWFQGIENAPYLVKECFKSLKDNITDREIVLITEQNYRDYVQFPDFIVKKIDSGVISKTHTSDLLRLELLKRYGGTWIDATVLCTGNIPNYMLDSDLFLFQNLKPGVNGNATCISNWFMTAKQNNKIINLTLDLLYEYWSKHNHLVDYFIFHDMFQLAIEAYPDEWNKVVPFSNSTPHILLLRLFEKYDENIWSAVSKMTPFHKLSYKFDDKNTKLENTYYTNVLKLQH